VASHFLTITTDSVCCLVLNTQSIKNRIGGIMVSMPTSSAVDRGFEPRTGQTKDYEIDIGEKEQRLVGSESR
jgi:hypothetical protein